MFPSNLHKNIVQLDRQISLLENECKNMEIDKRKKSFKSEQSNRCSKISSLQLKASPIKVTLKNIDGTHCLKRKKKVTSASGRLQSTSTLQSPGSQPWNESFENIPGKTIKVGRANANIPTCSCQKLSRFQCTSRKTVKCQNCDFNDESSELDLPKGDCGEDRKQDQVLHRELLFSNTGGAIEVTVTQKSSSGKEISPVKKKTDLEDKAQKDGDYKFQIKGQKWSEILCLDSSEKKSINKESISKNKYAGAEDITTINQPFSYSKNRGYDCNKTLQNIKNGSNNSTNNLSAQNESLEAPVKLSSPSNKVENHPKIKRNKLEQAIKCILESFDTASNDLESILESKDLIKIIQHLSNQLKQKPISVTGAKESPTEVETVATFKTSVKEPPKKLQKEPKQNFCVTDISQNYTSSEAMKQHCENLIKDKELLSKELAAKDVIIATMNKREEEYLSLISSLKLNLEKTKESAQESIEAIKEMNNLKNKLLEKMKFSETVQKNFSKAHDILERYILENQKLKTQIKILSLEAQKHEVLLAGKEAEISKYREEIQNFQRQITDHLAVLKSNAHEINVEKMMEVIFQQSQIFLQTDLDSVIGENDQKDVSKNQNALMHSSPTSSKTSVVNSSWKQISSIHDNNQSNGNAEVNLNDYDYNANDFFEIFGENLSSVSKSSKKLKQTLAENSVNGNGNFKRCLSFTSCISVDDDQGSISENTNIANSLLPNDETLSNEEKEVAEFEKSNRVSFEKAQSNIDEVLKNMKLNFSKKIFETSLGNSTTEDFLDSQISTISQ